MPLYPLPPAITTAINRVRRVPFQDTDGVLSCWMWHQGKGKLTYSLAQGIVVLGSVGWRLGDRQCSWWWRMVSLDVSSAPSPWVLFPFCSIPPSLTSPYTSCHSALHLWVCTHFPCQSVCSLNSTHEWNHMVFVFLWLISLSIMFSRSIHTISEGKIFFFMAN